MRARAICWCARYAFSDIQAITADMPLRHAATLLIILYRRLQALMLFRARQPYTFDEYAIQRYHIDDIIMVYFISKILMIIFHDAAIWAYVSAVTIYAHFLRTACFFFFFSSRLFAMPYAIVQDYWHIRWWYYYAIRQEGARRKKMRVRCWYYHCRAFLFIFDIAAMRACGGRRARRWYAPYIRHFSMEALAIHGATRYIVMPDYFSRIYIFHWRVIFASILRRRFSLFSTHYMPLFFDIIFFSLRYIIIIFALLLFFDKDYIRYFHYSHWDII